MVSVAPRCLRLGSGMLALSFGRPGLQLWLTNEPRGRTWQKFDLVAHHNQVSEPEHAIRLSANGAALSTGYTALCEMGPGRLGIAYDSVPGTFNTTPPTETFRNRVYIVEIALV